MIKVLFRWNTHLNPHISLTDGKVYDVIRHNKTDNVFDDTITITNDHGNVNTYRMFDNYNRPFFMNVTILHRNEIINEILL